MKDYIYIHYYSPNSTNPVSNRLLVTGFLRKWFGHKYFIYIDL